MLLWHGIDAMFEAPLYTGLVVLPLGIIGLGAAMLGTPDYGKRLGMPTVALGVVGLAAATAVGVPAMAALGVLALIGFHLTAGWKTHRQARTPHPRMVAGA